MSAPLQLCVRIEIFPAQAQSPMAPYAPNEASESDYQTEEYAAQSSSELSLQNEPATHAVPAPPSRSPSPLTPVSPVMASDNAEACANLESPYWSPGSPWIPPPTPQLIAYNNLASANCTSNSSLKSYTTQGQPFEGSDYDTGVATTEQGFALQQPAPAPEPSQMPGGYNDQDMSWNNIISTTQNEFGSTTTLNAENFRRQLFDNLIDTYPREATPPSDLSEVLAHLCYSRNSTVPTMDEYESYVMRCRGQNALTISHSIWTEITRPTRDTSVDFYRDRYAATFSEQWDLLTLQASELTRKLWSPSPHYYESYHPEVFPPANLDAIVPSSSRNSTTPFLVAEFADADIDLNEAILHNAYAGACLVKADQALLGDEFPINTTRAISISFSGTDIAVHLHYVAQNGFFYNYELIRESVVESRATLVAAYDVVRNAQDWARVMAESRLSHMREITATTTRSNGQPLQSLDDMCDDRTESESNGSALTHIETEDLDNVYTERGNSEEPGMLRKVFTGIRRRKKQRSFRV